MSRTPLVALGLLVVGTLQAAATVLLPLDFAELVGQADSITLSRVIDVRAVLVDGRAYSVVTAVVATAVKGPATEHVTFQVPGGDVGRYRTVVVGAPVLREGDEVVLFLRDRGQGLPIVVGFSQGVIRVLRQAVDDEPAVIAPPMARDPSRDERVVRGGSPGRWVRLDAFLDDVRALAAAGAAAPARPPLAAPGVSRPGAGSGGRQ